MLPVTPQNRSSPTALNIGAIVSRAACYSLQTAYGDYIPGSALRAARADAWRRGFAWCNDHRCEFLTAEGCAECVAVEGGGCDESRRD